MVNIHSNFDPGVYMRLIVLFVLFFLSLAHSVELKRGQHYEGPVKLTAATLGIGLGISSKWNASLGQKGPLKVVSETKDMTITLQAKEMTKESAVQYLTFPIEHQNGEILFPRERIIELTPTKFRRHYRMGSSDDAVMIYVILGPQRRAVVMTGIAQPKSMDSLQSEMFSIASTITFTPMKPLLDENNPLKSRLKGGHFVYYESVGQFNEKREVWLCSNGQFALRAHKIVRGSREIYKYHGSWVLDEYVLKLNMADGSQKKVYVRDEGKALFFNETRIYRLKNSVCR